MDKVNLVGFYSPLKEEYQIEMTNIRRVEEDDPINPSYYKRAKEELGVEVIDILLAFFPETPLLWQVGKYILRAGHKDSAVQDLKKARFYLDRQIEELEGA